LERMLFAGRLSMMLGLVSVALALPGMMRHDSSALVQTDDDMLASGDAASGELVPSPSDVKYLKSNFGNYIEDREGTLQFKPLDQKLGSWQQWTLVDAKNGTKYIISHLGHYLEDRKGSLQLKPSTEDLGSWQQWMLLSDSVTYLKSHFGNYIEDRQGGLQFKPEDEDLGDWQQWRLSSP